MTAIVQPLRLIGTKPRFTGARAATTVRMCQECVVEESSASEPWADFCRTLQRPAMLLAETDCETSASE